MRSFAWFLGAIVVAIVVASLAAYPTYLAIHPFVPEWRIDKIAGRLFDLALLLGLIHVVRRLKLTTRRDWGYGVPRPRWLRQFAFGLAAGVATMLPVTLAMLLLGAREPVPGFSAALLRHALLVGLGSGLVVGVLEETLFRGLLQGAVIRDSRRPLLAIVLVAALFAALHFLADKRIPPDAVTPASGVYLLTTVADNFLAPHAILDGFLALLAVGLLTGAVAWWTGSIALSAGLHAGWVWMMRTALITTRIDEHGGGAWLIYRPHGYVGWLTFAWTMTLLAALLLTRRRWKGWRARL